MPHECGASNIHNTEIYFFEFMPVCVRYQPVTINLSIVTIKRLAITVNEWDRVSFSLM